MEVTGNKVTFVNVSRQASPRGNFTFIGEKIFFPPEETNNVTLLPVTSLNHLSSCNVLPIG